MSELSPEAERALAALRAQVGSDDAHARVGARLAALGVAVSAVATSSVGSAGAAASVGEGASIAAPVAAGSASAGTVAAATAQSGAAAAGHVAASAGVLSKLAAASLAVKLGAGAAVLAGSAVLWSGLPPAPALHSQPTSAAGPGPRELPVRRAVPGVPPPALPDLALRLDVGDARRVEVPPAAPAPRTAPSLAPVPVRSPASPARVRSEPRGDDAREVVPGLAEEADMLEAALRALRGGDLATARALVERHARTFGARARLTEERERLLRELRRSLP